MDSSYRQINAQDLMQMVEQALINIVELRHAKWRDAKVQWIAAKNARQKKRLLVRLGLARPKTFTDENASQALKNDQEMFFGSTHESIYCKYMESERELKKLEKLCLLHVGASVVVDLSSDHAHLLDRWL